MLWDASIGLAKMARQANFLIGFLLMARAAMAKETLLAPIDAW